MFLMLIGSTQAVAAPWTAPLDEALDTIAATPAQRAAIRQIAGEAVRELREDQGATAAEIGRRAYDLFTAPTLDRGSLEQTRKDAVGWLDEASGALLPRAIEAAEVLSVDQRRQLAEAVLDEAGRWLDDPRS